MTIHETVAELDAGPIAAQERSRSASDDAGAVFARCGRGRGAAARRRCSRDAAASSRSRRRASTYAEKIAPADRELDLADPLDALAARPRALAAHRRAGRAARPPRDDLARAPRGRRASCPVEVQPEGRGRMSYDEFLRGLR